MDKKILKPEEVWEQFLAHDPTNADLLRIISGGVQPYKDLAQELLNERALPKAEEPKPSIWDKIKRGQPKQVKPQSDDDDLEAPDDDKAPDPEVEIIEEPEAEPELPEKLPEPLQVGTTIEKPKPKYMTPMNEFIIKPSPTIVGQPTTSDAWDKIETEIERIHEPPEFLSALYFKCNCTTFCAHKKDWVDYPVCCTSEDCNNKEQVVFDAEKHNHIDEEQYYMIKIEEMTLHGLFKHIPLPPPKEKKPKVVPKKTSVAFNHQEYVKRKTAKLTQEATKDFDFSALNLICLACGRTEQCRDELWPNNACTCGSKELTFEQSEKVDELAKRMANTFEDEFTESVGRGDEAQ